MNALLVLMLAVNTASETPSSPSTAAPDIVLLDFTATYCPPCQQMLPIIQRLEDEGFPVQRIDTTEHPELLQKFRVNGIPTFILLKDGKEIWRKVGQTPEYELRDVLERSGAAKENRQSAAMESEQPEIEVPVRSDDAVGEEEVTRSNTPPTAAASGNRREDGTLGGFFRGLLKGNANGNREFPTFRGQDPSSEIELNDLLRNAAAATVRVKVTGKRLQDVGTGTIIHSTTGESIILTCAHIFLGQQKDALVEVEMFQDTKVLKFPAQVVSGDHNSDLAILKIRTTSQMPFVPVMADPVALSVSQSLVSFGCNKGGVPSSLATRVVEINKWKGPSNVTCEVDPVQGRSGGGLFTMDGELVAVCSAADREVKTGLYMSHTAIVELLKRSKLEHVTMTRSAAGEDAAVAFQEGRSVRDSNSARPEVTAESVASNAPVNPGFDVPEAVQPKQEVEVVPEFEENLPTMMGSGTSVTVVIEPKVRGGKKRTVVIPNATPWLIELLTGESTSGANASASR
ncbi:MAG: trypsin-like peptidase domain-containing protein [Planctomyces sp.]|nr:trypsin-like peptidase domain-containing protein [Planctomyces sp.]